MRVRRVQEAAPAAAAEPGRRPGFRADIQALRAIAVGAVLLWHIDPAALPGGFVGVDVFFVISGYLMTIALTREPRLGWRGMAGFWARRCRRIMPVASLVIVVTLVAAWFLLPATRRVAAASDSIWAGAYLINWRLADSAVDYLASLEPPSHLQHFWSLAVEEQFYLFWPLLIGAALYVSFRAQSSRAMTLGVAIGAVVLISFLCSVVLTAAQPQSAYFSTFVRLWELALGGLVALLPTISGRLAAAVGLLGAAGIVTALLALPAESAFPGWIALWPTVGTALVIWGGISGRLGAALRWRPVQWLGDVSYSLYLWHWPVIVLLNPYDRPTELLSWFSIVVIGASLVLAWWSWKHVEQPFRAPTAPRWRKGTRGGLRLGLVALLVVALVALPARVVAPAMAQPPTYPGPPASAPGAPALADGASTGEPIPGGGFIPSPQELAADLPFMYAEGCHLGVEEVRPVPCVLEPAGGSDRTIVLVGDSHAAQWAPALAEIAEERSFRLVVHTKSNCPFGQTSIALRGFRYAECDSWNDAVLEQIASLQPELVVTSNTALPVWHEGESRQHGSAEEPMAAGLAQAWAVLLSGGSTVAVLRDTPVPGFAIDACVANEPLDLGACSFERDLATVDDGNGQALALAREPRALQVDLTAAICPTEECPAVVGGVVVYRDRGHLSATYARSLADPLTDALLAVGALPDR